MNLVLERELAQYWGKFYLIKNIFTEKKVFHWKLKIKVPEIFFKCVNPIVSRGGLINCQIYWGSEYWIYRVFKWYKAVQLLNGLVFNWHVRAGPFFIFGFSNDTLKPDRFLNTILDCQKVIIIQPWYIVYLYLIIKLHCWYSPA